MHNRLPLPAVQCVEFEIVGDPLDPAAVTAALGLEPDSAEPPGPVSPVIADQFREFFGDAVDDVILPGHWKLETVGHVAARWLEPHLRYLLGLLEPRRDALLALAERAELRLNITFRPSAECKLPSHQVVRDSESLVAAAAFERLGIKLYSLSITGFPHDPWGESDDLPWKT